MKAALITGVDLAEGRATAHGRGRSAFLETLIVTAVMVAFAATTVAGYQGAANYVRKTRARADIAALDKSLKAFIARHGDALKDTQGVGAVLESQTIKALKRWGCLKGVTTTPSGILLDPWNKPYVIILRRDYGARGDQALRDADGKPFNDRPDGFQIYSRSFRSGTYSGDYGLTNIRPGQGGPTRVVDDSHTQVERAQPELRPLSAAVLPDGQ